MKVLAVFGVFLFAGIEINRGAVVNNVIGNINGVQITASTSIAIVGNAVVAYNANFTNALFAQSNRFVTAGVCNLNDIPGILSKDISLKKTVTQVTGAIAAAIANVTGIITGSAYDLQVYYSSVQGSLQDLVNAIDGSDAQQNSCVYSLFTNLIAFITQAQSIISLITYNLITFTNTTVTDVVFGLVAILAAALNATLQIVAKVAQKISSDIVINAIKSILVILSSAVNSMKNLITSGINNIDITVCLKALISSFKTPAGPTTVLVTRPPEVTVLPTRPPVLTVLPTRPPEVAVLPTRPPEVSVLPTRPPELTVLPTRPPEVAVLPTRPPELTVLPTKPQEVINQIRPTPPPI